MDAGTSLPVSAPLLLRWNQSRKPYHHLAPFVARDADDITEAALAALAALGPDPGHPPLRLQGVVLLSRDRSPPVTEWRDLPMPFDPADIGSVRVMLELRKRDIWDMACAMLAQGKGGGG